MNIQQVHHLFTFNFQLSTFNLYLPDKEIKLVDILQRNPRTSCYCMQRIVCHVKFDPHLVAQTFVDTTQQSAATGQIDAVFYDIGIQFRRDVYKRQA